MNLKVIRDYVDLELAGHVRTMMVGDACVPLYAANDVAMAAAQMAARLAVEHVSWPRRLDAAAGIAGRIVASLDTWPRDEELQRACNVAVEVTERLMKMAMEAEVDDVDEGQTVE